MEENYLQAGFEIKLACDALSRRMLRWHWEKTPRPNTLKEFISYVKTRADEAPDYYANSTQIIEKPGITWQQFDTTFCMRVLLDGEANTTKPKRLLQYALQENTARRACNGLRMARNAAAHATDRLGVVKAISLFDETLDDLERAYGLLLFKQDELSSYDELVTRATEACKTKRTPAKTTAARTTGQGNVASSQKATGTAGAKRTATQTKNSQAANKSTKSASTAGGAKTTRTPKSTGKKQPTRGTKTPKKQAKQAGVTLREKIFITLAVVVFFAAFILQVSRM